MKMKRFRCVVVLSIIGTLFVHADIYSFHATSISSREENKDGSWTEWSEWVSSSGVIKYDTEREKVLILTDPMLSFDVYDVQKNQSDNDGGMVVKLSCVDDSGLKCGIDIRNAQSGGVQIYLRYGDVEMVFNVNAPDNVRNLFPNYISEQRGSIDTNKTNQNSTTYLSVSKTSISCSANGTTEYLTVNCNGTWSIQYPSNAMYSTTRSGNTIIVRVAANTSTTSRSDFFYVVCGDKKVKINISQSGMSGTSNNASSSTTNASTLSVSKTSIIIGASGTTEYLTVTSNRAWEVQFPTGGMYAVTRNGNTLKVVISANTTSGTREDFFNVRLVDGSKTIRVKLWQSGRVSSSQTSDTSDRRHGSNSRTSSNRSTYHQSAYERYIAMNGKTEITWFGISATVGTGVSLTSSITSVRSGPFGVKPIDITVGYDFINGEIYFAYHPIFDFYIPVTNRKALYFGAGPSMVFKEDASWWFRTEGGLHWEWGSCASSDFFFRYDGSYTLGVSIQWSSIY